PSSSRPRSMVCRSYGVPSRSVSTTARLPLSHIVWVRIVCVADRSVGDNPIHRHPRCPQPRRDALAARCRDGPRCAPGRPKTRLARREQMFDTNVTVVGTALNTPEWRRTTSGALVAHFKVASHSRRYDKDSGRWVDGDSLRVRVTCWRRLAEGVAASVLVGDPVIVTGRMYTRDWIAEDGQARVSYEVEAEAVGHDLARGQGTFTRSRAATATSAVEDAEADGRIAGEPAERVA